MQPQKCIQDADKGAAESSEKQRGLTLRQFSASSHRAVINVFNG